MHLSISKLSQGSSSNYALPIYTTESPSQSHGTVPLGGQIREFIIGTCMLVSFFV
jgi:hypothetical protein